VKADRQLDEIDFRILKDLLHDGRKSFKEIAKECNVSASTISERFKEMEKAGIIVGATTQYHASYFGFRGIATLLLNVESQYVDEVFERLRKTGNFLAQRQYNVKHNIIVITGWKNPRDLDVAKETIRRLNPIEECKTYLWTDVRNTPENLTLGLRPSIPIDVKSKPVEKECSKTRLQPSRS
jgi:DNA-binding Lrp family transcriptional regulator